MWEAGGGGGGDPPGLRQASRCQWVVRADRVVVDAAAAAVGAVLHYIHHCIQVRTLVRFHTQIAELVGLGWMEVRILSFPQSCSWGHIYTLRLIAVITPIIDNMGHY